MRVTTPFTCRGGRIRRRWAIITLVAMLVSPLGGPLFMPIVRGQTVAPPSQGFTLTAGDVRYIYDQILVAQDHAAGLALLGPGPNQVHDPQLPRGLRTVDGSFNNLVPVPDQHLFGAADLLFPRMTGTKDPVSGKIKGIFRDADAGTSYKQLSGTVVDASPRLITNLIVDQSANNP